jgi:hypothetical protein
MKTILDEAKELAVAHRNADPATTIIKFFPTAHAGQICLLEVSGSAPTTGEVMPFTFSPDTRHGVNHPSTVILLSPEEWGDVQMGRLPLPPDWVLSTAEAL